MGSHQRCCDTALRGIIGNQPLIPGIAKFLASRDARFVRPYNQLEFNYYARTHEPCVPTIWAKFVGSATPSKWIITNHTSQSDVLTLLVKTYIATSWFWRYPMRLSAACQRLYQ